MFKKLYKYLRYFVANLKTKKKPLDKNLWLISERGFDAQDNGYHLYKYIQAHPELGIKAVYLINKGSSDYKKIADLGGQICEPNSQEHYELMYQAGALISTHTYGYTPNMTVYHNLAKHRLFNPKGVSVFLQHGITDKIQEWTFRENYRPDVYVVSSDIEKEKIETEFKQPKETIADIGMCRYDKLNEAGEAEKVILVMPTWRMWLTGTSEKSFLESEYCKKWMSLLLDKSFISNINKQGYKLIFYLHPELRKYESLFKQNGVETASVGLQDIMMKADTLVTDYSSVYFDMAYMNRNIVFWQFDRDRYATEHYQGLFVDHSKFGYMADNEDDIPRAILEHILNGIDYGDRDYINKFFIYRDNKNCERTITTIKNKI